MESALGHLAMATLPPPAGAFSAAAGGNATRVTAAALHVRGLTLVGWLMQVLPVGAAVADVARASKGWLAPRPGTQLRSFRAYWLHLKLYSKSPAICHEPIYSAGCRRRPTRSLQRLLARHKMTQL